MNSIFNGTIGIGIFRKEECVTAEEGISGYHGIPRKERIGKSAHQKCPCPHGQYRHISRTHRTVRVNRTVTARLTELRGSSDRNESG